MMFTLLNQLSTTIQGVACRMQQSHVIKVVCGNCIQELIIVASQLLQDQGGHSKMFGESFFVNCGRCKPSVKSAELQQEALKWMHQC